MNLKDHPLTLRIVETLLGQSGLGLLVAAVFGYDHVTVYGDLKLQNEVQIEMIRLNVRASQDVAASIIQLPTRSSGTRMPVSKVEKKP